MHVSLIPILIYLSSTSPILSKERVIPIEIEYLTQYIYIEQLNELDTFKVHKGFIVTKFKSNKGAGDIWKYSSKGKLLMEGHYVDALDTFKGYVVESHIDFSLEMGVHKYFEPLKDGKWVFYKKNGKIKKVEEFVRGINVKDQYSIQVDR